MAKFTFAQAKEEIKDLTEKLAEANVKLNDNIVTEGERKWLRVYKGYTFITIGGLLLWAALNKVLF